MKMANTRATSTKNGGGSNKKKNNHRHKDGVPKDGDHKFKIATNRDTSATSSSSGFFWKRALPTTIIYTTIFLATF